VNINAYHQPGVEAGKKAATDVLQLQERVQSALASGSGATAEEIAGSLGADPESVFHALRHLAANDEMIGSSVGEEAAQQKFFRRS
jgi:glucose-6-phosphate isomerase